MTVLVVKAASTGMTDSGAVILPSLTSEATETAAECVSAKPAPTAATRTPGLAEPVLRRGGDQQDDGEDGGEGERRAAR